jgi:hypothetical protein
VGNIRSTLAPQAGITAAVDEPLEVRPLAADSGPVAKTHAARAKPGVAVLDEASSQTWRSMIIGGAVAIGLAALGLSAVYMLTH